MIKYKVLQEFQITKFLQFLNDSKSSFRFTIKDEKYIDLMFDEMENYNTQIKLLLPLLYNKFPILLERQKQFHKQYASFFKLRIDEDCVTKNKEINYPIIGIQDYLINDPLFCDQQIFFENLEYQLQQNDGQLEIMIDVEEFGLILLFSRLIKLILKLHEKNNIKDVKFDIIIFPSNNNFAIIKQNTYLYFYDEQHLILFLKQNSKKFSLNLFHQDSVLQFAYNKSIEIFGENNQQDKLKLNEQCSNSKNQTKSEKYKNQLNYQLFKIYQTEELIEKGKQIKNRSNQKFRNQLSIKRKFNDQFIVIKNQINFSFSNLKQCKSNNYLNHIVEIQNDSILKCTCGQQITVDNFDLLVIDPVLINCIQIIQDILLFNNSLDSCLFGYPIHLEVINQNRAKIITANADEQLLFEVTRDEFFFKGLNEDSRSRELFEINNYPTEEDWEDKSSKLQHLQDRNKTNE